MMPPNDHNSPGSIPEQGKITEQALIDYEQRVGTKLQINNIFNEEVTKDAIRKFADGIGDDNPLWLDEDYAGQSPYKNLVAPPSWLHSVFPSWVVQGLNGVHAIHVNTLWKYYKPVYLHDQIKPECYFTGFEVQNSSFEDTAVIERQEASYYNQTGELVAMAFPVVLRTERQSARQIGKYKDLQLPHPWTEQELQKIEEQVLKEEIRGSTPLYWQDVYPEDDLPQLVKGPFNQCAAQASGLPYPYDIEGQRHYWLIQLVTNWMGDYGWIKSTFAKYQNFVYFSDVIWLSGKVKNKYTDQEGEACLDILITAINQRGEEVMSGIAIVALPRKGNCLEALEPRLR